MISRDEVFYLYKCFFGREPENEGAVMTHQQHYDFETARKAFLASDEFLLLSGDQDIKELCYKKIRHGRPFVKSSVTLGLAAIVKNEEKRVAEMINSCLPIVDFVSIIDTGSSDKTVDVIGRVLKSRNIRSNVESIAFRDFSHARNISVSNIPSDIDWVLVLDADEHLVEEDFTRLLELTESDVIDAWQLPRYNFYDEAKVHAASPYPDYQRRLFRHRSTDAIHYVGSVHERLNNVKAWGFAPAFDKKNKLAGGPHIHHMGQVDLTREQWQVKHDFYCKLAMLNARGEPPT